MSHKRFLVELSSEERTYLKQLVSSGSPKTLPARPTKLDGTAQAELARLACSTLPPGRARWTLKLLAAELVALDVVDAIVPETVRRALKKTR